MGKFSEQLTAAPQHNPASDLLAQLKAQPAPAPAKTEAPKGKGTARDRVAETRKDGTANKTARLELITTPATKAALQARAKAEGRTVNGLINYLVEAYLEKEGE